MKRFLALSLIGTSFFIGSSPLKADWDTYGISFSGSTEMLIKKCDSSTGSCDSGVTRTSSFISVTPALSWVDDENNLILYMEEQTTANDTRRDKLLKYNGSTESFTDLGANWKEEFNWTYNKFAVQKNTDGSIQIGSNADDVDVVEDGLNIDGTAVVTKNLDGSVQIGSDTNDIDVTAEGINIDGSTLITKSSNTISIGESLRILEDSRKLLMNGNTIIKRNDDGTIQIGTDDDDIDITSQGINVGGRPLITRRADGKIHIGKNSLITTEEEETLSDGRKVQPLYAEDGDTNKIPINIDGSKLLIDGVEVKAGNHEQITTNKNNIKNLGEGVAGSTALTAALTALPQTSKESKLSCGFGSGAYSSKYAVSFGCASKVNERVDINGGGSYVFGGSKSYGEGTLDSGVLKAGFVFKLGELKKPIQISMKDKKVMETKIETLEEKNKQLLARLERLEKIALGESNSKDLVVYKLK